MTNEGIYTWHGLRHYYWSDTWHVARVAAKFTGVICDTWLLLEWLPLEWNVTRLEWQATSRATVLMVLTGEVTHNFTPYLSQCSKEDTCCPTNFCYCRKSFFHFKFNLQRQLGAVFERVCWDTIREVTKGSDTSEISYTIAWNHDGNHSWNQKSQLKSEITSEIKKSQMKSWNHERNLEIPSEILKSCRNQPLYFCISSCVFVTPPT